MTMVPGGRPSPSSARDFATGGGAGRGDRTACRGGRPPSGSQPAGGCAGGPSGHQGALVADGSRLRPERSRRPPRRSTRGPRADPDVGVRLDALDVDKVRAFWCAVLGYELAGDTTRRPRRALSGRLRATDGRDAHRSQPHLHRRRRSHEQAEARVAAALAAGGTIVNDSCAPMWWTLRRPRGQRGRTRHLDRSRLRTVAAGDPARRATSAPKAAQVRPGTPGRPDRTRPRTIAWTSTKPAATIRLRILRLAAPLALDEAMDHRLHRRGEVPGHQPGAGCWSG